jgi:hypothetical protein
MWSTARTISSPSQDALAQSTTITVPPGNYTYRDLCRTVSRLYPSVTCTYDNYTNRAVFKFSSPHAISFVNNSYQTFGFNSSDLPSRTSIVSTNQLDLKGGVNQLVLHAAGVSTTACWNVDNFSSDQDLKCKPSDVLTVIPFDRAPFTVLHWQNPGNQFEMFLNERNISRLQIIIKDIYTGQRHNLFKPLHHHLFGEDLQNKCSKRTEPDCGHSE